jgi:enoyl-CoA hydratase/carnithine racemase
MDENHIKHSTDDGVLRIVIDRPDARNALSKRMYGAIRDLCRKAYVDDSIQAVVVQGTQGAFAVGGDLREMLESLDRDGGTDLFGYDECLPFEAVRSLPKPTIAAVDGLCFGGGLTLALLCDIVVATETSRFAMPEARVGVVDGHLPRLLRDRVPPAWLRYWLYTGTTFPAGDALAAGLVTKVVPAGELEDAVQGVLAELGQAAPQAIRLYKKILNETRPLSSMEDAYETLFTEEVRDRLRAFSARKK